MVAASLGTVTSRPTRRRSGRDWIGASKSSVAPGSEGRGPDRTSAVTRMRWLPAISTMSRPCRASPTSTSV
jgi:hypothetical protein